MSFRPLGEHALHALDDEPLVAHVAAAKRAGDLEQARAAVHMLLYKHQDRMQARVALRLPPHLAHHAQTVADWVLPQVMKSALKLQFRGSSVGEWVTWWGVACDRQVISFWRTAQGQALEREAQLPDDDGVDRLGQDIDFDRVIARACYAEIVQAVFETMNPAHAAVVKAAIFDDLASKDVAARFGITDMNVDTIKTRFKRGLREECRRRGVDGS